MNPKRRIEELEAQVKRLTDELQALKGTRESAGERAPARHPRAPAGTGAAWFNRAGLLVMAVTVGLAAVLALYGEIRGEVRTGDLAQEIAGLRGNYVLLVCAGLAAAALVSYSLRRHFLFIFLAWAATFLAYEAAFRTRPDLLSVSDRGYFWISSGFLTLTYMLFSTVYILEGRRVSSSRRRRLSAMAALNTIVYFVLVYPSVSTFLPNIEWVFRLGFAGVLVLLAVLAETSGPRRNYLFQLFAAKAVIAFTFAIEAFLPGQRLWIATAVECIALAAAYRLSGIVMFKVLNLLLLVVTFAGAVCAARTPTPVAVGSLNVPENWYIGGFAMGASGLLAVFYHHVGRPAQTQSRSGQWFLAGSAVDVPRATASMFHAAAAALILVALTILEIEDQTLLPPILMGVAVAVGVLGVLTATPQLEVGGVLALVAAHVSYYFVLVHPPEIVEPLPGGLASVWAMAAFTYLAAFRWERYLRRVKIGSEVEHHVVAAVPYLMATVLLVTLAAQRLPGLQAPATQCGFGLALLTMGVALRSESWKASGVAAIIGGIITFTQRLYSPDTPLATHSDYVLYLGLVAAFCVVGERYVFLLERWRPPPFRVEPFARTLQVVGAALLSIVAVREWAGDDLAPFYWLCAAVAFIVLALLTGEDRYRWAGLLMMTGVTCWTMFVVFPDLAAPLRYGLLGGVAGLLGFTIWRDLRRQRALLAGRFAQKPK